jgi:hypothetical protein
MEVLFCPCCGLCDSTIVTPCNHCAYQRPGWLISLRPRMGWNYGNPEARRVCASACGSPERRVFVVVGKGRARACASSHWGFATHRSRYSVYSGYWRELSRDVTLRVRSSFS